MSRKKLRVINTELDNLVSNLRGEVGEVITAWMMLRFLMTDERKRLSKDIAADMRNQELMFVSILRDKMHDEIIARLSELSEDKIGRLNFHFASVKLDALQNEVATFRYFIQRHKFEEKRNHDISHKELPERWSQHRHIHIPYKTLLHGIARASVLMKKIDRIVLGPSAPYLWHEMRKNRYSMTMAPPSSMYLVLPHLYLSKEVREKIIMQEMAEGGDVWSEMEIKINGTETKVLVCKKWGAVLLDHIMCLDSYPLQIISELMFSGQAVEAKPVFEEKEISAKYRAEKVTDNEIVFVPLRRVHLLDDGRVTELCNITIRLDAKLKIQMGEMKIGDEKEFRITAQLLAGYKKHAEGQASQ